MRLVLTLIEAFGESIVCGKEVVDGCNGGVVGGDGVGEGGEGSFDPVELGLNGIVHI